MTEIQKAFLTRLASLKQGRCSYDLVRRDDVVEIVGELIQAGYVKDRRFGYGEGLQITERGREYLGGAA